MASVTCCTLDNQRSVDLHSHGSRSQAAETTKSSDTATQLVGIHPARAVLLTWVRHAARQELVRPLVDALYSWQAAVLTR